MQIRNPRVCNSDRDLDIVSESALNAELTMTHDPELVGDILPRVIAQITTARRQIVVVQLPSPPQRHPGPAQAIVGESDQ